MSKDDSTGKIQWDRLLKKLSPYTVQKGLRYLKHYGLKEFWIRLHERFEPEFAPQKAPMMTLVMGLSVAQAVEDLGLDVGIKWPNDVVVSRKKICGILTEMTMKQDKIGCAVIGVGINVNMDSFPEEMADKATSLYLESGHPFDRAEVTGLVMKHFDEN